jgi:uncharacterized membrane protein YkoI
MKKKWKIALLATFVLVSLAFGAQRIVANQNQTVVSQEEIKQLVDKQYAGTVKSIELTKKDNQEVYKVIFSNNKGEYELLVNAYNKEVMELAVLAMAEKKITPEQAKEITEIVNKKVEGKIKSMDVIQEGDKDLYVVEVQKNEKELVVLKIDKNTKEIVSEVTHTTPPTPITEQKAKDIASQEIEGVTITSIDLEGLVYKVIGKKDKSTIEVEVNAITGEAVTTVTNQDDDDDDKPASTKPTNNQNNKPNSNQNNNPTNKQNKQPVQNKDQGNKQNDDDNDDQGNDDDGQGDD